MWTWYRINTDQIIRILEIKILDKSEKMVSQEDNVVIIFMNSFNAVHAFTKLLKWGDYINNASLLR